MYNLILYRTGIDLILRLFVPCFYFNEFLLFSEQQKLMLIRVLKVWDNFGKKTNFHLKGHIKICINQSKINDF